MFRLKNYVNSFRRYIKIYKNPAETLWKIFNKRFPFMAKLKDGKTIEIPNSNFAWIVSFGLDVNYDYRGQILYLNYNGHNLKFLGTEVNGEIPEVFGYEDYGKFDYRDETVIDVGANIGDSSIYFATKGATRVIAIEPFPSSYSLLEQNISLNELEGIIVPMNAAVGENDGFVNLRPDIKTTTGLGIYNSDNGVKVRIVSLNKLVEIFNLKNSILKIDCEGCEYEVINSKSIETLAAFKGLIIEYHFGLRELRNNIKEKFDVEIVSKTGKAGLIIGVRKSPKPQ